MAAVKSEVVAEPASHGSVRLGSDPSPEQLTTHISCPNFTLIDDIKRGAGNAIGDGIKSKKLVSESCSNPSIRNTHPR